MKTLISTLCALICTHLSYSQNWIVVEQNDQFSITYSEINYENSVDGINHQRLIFNYENHTSEEITLTFSQELTYSKTEKIPNDYGLSAHDVYTVKIPANSTVGYDSNSSKPFYLFKADNNKLINKSLIDFKFIHLRIKK